MIGAPMPAARTPRAAAKPADGAGANDDDPETQARHRALEAQHQAFDIETAETAELEREREALEAIMLARLKDEDEILKKFVELI